MRFGHVLRKIRLEKQVSIRQLAKKIGFSATYIHMVELGKCSPPPPERIQIIADELGVDSSVLLEAAHKEKLAINEMLRRGDSRIYDIINCLSGMSDEELSKARDMILSICTRKEVQAM